MAAIIAQMTRANRERKLKKRIESAKCMYEIPPFDPTFHVKLHNSWYSRRAKIKFAHEEVDMINAKLSQYYREHGSQDAKKSILSIICEVVIVLGLLSIVPFLLLFFNSFFQPMIEMQNRHFNGTSM